ncbi:hypothetical protein [Pinibacter soli]|uniref:Glycosyltransferase RgtA/B/C/D-like domain-containing protein n=1 Tax=Pinibacter soli TaxID=3044211 RepID=A0ABT6REC6_9BACT|nr:hypothetical protein [Pinibacter soli]MDI3320219.1 hypothetical protein [Pinibacter soli]
MRSNSKITLPLFVFFSLIVALVVYWWGYDKPSYGIDDANIYFVYMKHFAEGHGFVWNIGGEKVEGFTSLLWTLIGSFFYKISGERFTWLLLALNLVLTYIGVYRLLLFVRRCNGTVGQKLAYTDILIMTLLLFPLGFMEWSVLGLMETGFWLFLIVNTTLELCNYYLLNRKVNLYTFSLLLAAMVVTRPESILFALLFIFIFFIQNVAADGVKKAIARSILPLLVYAATVVGLISWRLSYFGYAFPNTYYAKVSGSLKDNIGEGLRYFSRLFYGYPQLGFVMAMLVFFSVILLNKWRKEKKNLQLTANDKVQIILIAVIFVGLCLPILTGGDHFKFARFYQCIIPLSYAAVLNVPFMEKWIGKLYPNNRGTGIVLTVSAITAIFFIAKSTWFEFTAPDKIIGNRILGDFNHAYNGRTIAEKANKTFESCKTYPSIGLLAAGGFCYSYKGNTVDLMGLNSTIMAHASRIKHGFRNHASFDINGFWKLKPDVVGTFYGGEVVTDTADFILPENTADFRNGAFIYASYKRIFDYPQFIATYLPALVRSRDTNYFIFAYYSKDFLESLDKEKMEVILLERKIHAPVPM